MKNNSLISKFAIYVFIGVMFSRVLGYLYRVVIARYSVESYGLYNLGLFLVQLVVPIALLGLSLGIPYYVGHYQGKSDKKSENRAVTTSIWVVSAISLILFLLFYFGDNLIAGFFGKPGLAIFVKYFAFLIPITALVSLFSSVLKANNKVFHMVLFVSIVQSILEVILIYFLIKGGLAEKALILSVLIPAFITLLGVSYFTLKQFSFDTSKFDNELILYSLPLFPIAFVFSFMTLMDSLMLGYFSSVSDVAFYNAALPTAQIILVFSSALLTVFLPLISKKNALGKKVGEEYYFVLRGIFFCTLPFLIISLLFNERIITMLFGNAYLSGATAFSILTLAYFVYGISQPANNVLMMLKHQKKLLVITLSLFIVNFVLNLFLIPYSINKYGGGTIGASLATFVSFFLLAIALFFLTYKYADIKPLGRGLGKIIFASFISLAVVYTLRKLIGIIEIKVFFVYLIIYVVIYIFILYEVKFFEKKEVDLLKRMFRR